MKTLNQLKYELIGFFESHGQVNDVKYEDDFDFNAERNLNYPAVNIEYLESNLSNKAMNHSFKIVLGDMVDDNVEGMEDEVFSDMLQIAEDFFTFAQNKEGFEASRTANIQKFSNDTKDRVSGVVFRIVLSVIRPQNDCSKPSRQGH